MSLVTIQRSPSPSDQLDDSPTNDYDESIVNKSQSEDFFASKATAVLQNQVGRRRSSVINDGDAMQHGLKMAVGLLRKEDKLRLIVNIEKVNSKTEGLRYFCLLMTNGKHDMEEYLILGIDIILKKATIGLVLPICQDMSVTLDGDGGFKVKYKEGEKLFKPTSVHALWSTVQLLNKACSIAHSNNYYIGGVSHTWVGFYTKQIASNRAQIAEWNKMIDADAVINSKMAPKSAIGEFVIGTHINEDIQRQDEMRNFLTDMMRDLDMDNVSVVFLRDKLQEKVSFDVKEYKSFIEKEILIIYGQIDSASQILPYLYLGSTYNASNLEELLNNKVTHILNVTRECENFFREKFTYHNVEVFDVEETKLLNHFNDCYQFISEAKYQNTVCLVHCQRGISRSASVVIAYLMKEFNWPLDKAIEDVKSKRSCIHPNDGFMIQLKEYEGILRSSREYVMVIEQKGKDWRFANEAIETNSFKSKNRHKIKSFPNEVYQGNENDNSMQSPVNTRATSHERQCVSQYGYPSTCLTDISSTNINMPEFITELDTTLRKESPNIDINDDLLMYKNNTIDADPNENIFEADELNPVFLPDRSSNISENVKVIYSTNTSNVSGHDDSCPENMDKITSDCNANDTSCKSQRNEFVKRSLRLKGDASWIRQPSDACDQTTNQRGHICRSHIIETDDENATQFPRTCHSDDFDQEDMAIAQDQDVDEQSLRPVKELLTKYTDN